MVRGAWARAFVGFYRAQDASARELDPIARFLYSARSVILVISAQAALIAGLLALADRRFDPLSFLLVLIGFIDAHAISNLSNDYFGYRRGHDTPDSPRMRYTVHPLASGLLTPRQLAAGLAVLGLVGLAITGFFVATRGPVALAFAGAGIALLFLYDASPIPLKSIGLGEIASFLVWGPLMVGGGYFVIAGQLRLAPFLVSVPYGLGVASILVGKHIDQRGVRHRPGPADPAGRARRARGAGAQPGVGRADVRRRRGPRRQRHGQPARGRRRRGAAAGSPGDRADGPSAADRAAERLRRLAALVPPGLPHPQPALRLALHCRPGGGCGARLPARDLIRLGRSAVLITGYRGTDTIGGSPAMTTTPDGWARYGGALMRAMAEVLPEFPDEVRPQALEVADYWISVGLALGLERPHQARELLALIEPDESERTALELDAAAFIEEALG